MPVKNPNIAHDKRTGRGARFTTLTNGWTVETYYNRHLRSFCTCVKDSDGNINTADADGLNTNADMYEYAGGFKWARLNHEEAIKRVIDIILLEKVK